jgi:hypothetical protein
VLLGTPQPENYSSEEETFNRQTALKLLILIGETTALIE